MDMESEDEAICSINTTPVKTYHDTCDFGQYRLCYDVSHVTPLEDEHQTSTPEKNRKQFCVKEVNKHTIGKVDPKYTFLPIVESSVNYRHINTKIMKSIFRNPFYKKPKFTAFFLIFRMVKQHWKASNGTTTSSNCLKNPDRQEV